MCPRYFCGQGGHSLTCPRHFWGLRHSVIFMVMACTAECARVISMVLVGTAECARVISEVFVGTAECAHVISEVWAGTAEYAQVILISDGHSQMCSRYYGDGTGTAKCAHVITVMGRAQPKVPASFSLFCGHSGTCPCTLASNWQAQLESCTIPTIQIPLFQIDWLSKLFSHTNLNFFTYKYEI